MAPGVVDKQHGEQDGWRGWNEEESGKEMVREGTGPDHIGL